MGWTDGSNYLDKADFCQAANQVAGSEPGGISVRVWPAGSPSDPPGGEVW
jgi:hypothetical protein